MLSRDHQVLIALGSVFGALLLLAIIVAVMGPGNDEGPVRARASP